MTESQKIIAWLKSRDLINIAKLEAKTGISQGDLTKCRNGHRKLPEKHVAAVIAALKDYGYKTESK